MLPSGAILSVVIYKVWPSQVLILMKLNSQNKVTLTERVPGSISASRELKEKHISLLKDLPKVLAFIIKE